MSTDHLHLRELESCTVTLQPSEAEFLLRRHQAHVGLSPGDRSRSHGDDTTWLATPQQVCGVIPLPSGRCIYIEPKARIANVWHMLAHGWEAVELGDPVVETETVAGLLDGIMVAYVRELCRLVDRGLTHGYSRRRETLPLVRGRLDIWAQLHTNAGARHRFVCVFDEFSADTPENRILLAALDVVRASCGRGLGLGAGVQHCLRALSGVPGASVGARDLSDVRTPGSEHYRTPLALARLLLDGCGASHRPGARAAPALIVDMPRLFERFVCGVLARGLPRHLRVRQAGHTIALDEDRRTLLAPDALIECGGVPVCVVDAKYKLGERGAQATHQEPGADDLYQMLAYCVGYQATEAVLVYPEPSDTPPLRIRRDPCHARVHTIGLDLSGDWHSVKRECQRLCRRVADLAKRAAA